MPPKRRNLLSIKHKCQLRFLESPKEIPHGLLSPIPCSNFQLAARVTEIKNNLSWVSPQFTGIKDLHTKQQRKRNPKPNAENECPKEHNRRYGSLQFLKPTSLHKPFQDCQSLSNIENIMISPKFTNSEDTLKPTCPWNLFQNSPLEQKDYGKILVPDTPEREYGLSVRHRQLGKFKK
ncbi:uncharacterized protein LOC106874409 isoform X2 [Octopus bimaculoides]|nr:uncharacterized protein LOC106874409 isoform X2 [Octopus bimaculoides]XP_014777639.1 uncharacterized protein LOC106874409 isoform X2 [Octopus bimaculoides]|eukprot:XP_014777631.1 PREDICTED: uncharacterized protein LOC106874409 isoform X2 [Octopus bimaculoides]